MTVKELKQKLEGVPDNMDVVIRQTDTEYAITMTQHAAVEVVKFTDGNVTAKDKCFVITDEI